MLQNGPHASESKILQLVRNSSGYRETPSSEEAEIRKRWPFKVAVVYGSTPREDDRLLGQPDQNSFIT